jgi:hypothetical protein
MEILIAIALSTMLLQLGLCIFCFVKKNEEADPRVSSYAH